MRIFHCMLCMHGVLWGEYNLLNEWCGKGGRRCTLFVWWRDFFSMRVSFSVSVMSAR